VTTSPVQDSNIAHSVVSTASLLVPARAAALAGRRQVVSKIVSTSRFSTGAGPLAHGLCFPKAFTAAGDRLHRDARTE
jgi:hypothetical protein